MNTDKLPPQRLDDVLGTLELLNALMNTEGGIVLSQELAQAMREVRRILYAENTEKCAEYNAWREVLVAKRTIE